MSKHHHGSFWSLDTQVYDICLAMVTRICLDLGLYSSEWLTLHALKEDTPETRRYRQRHGVTLPWTHPMKSGGSGCHGLLSQDSLSNKGLHKQQIAVSLAVMGKWEWMALVAARLKWRWRDMSRHGEEGVSWARGYHVPSLEVGCRLYWLSSPVSPSVALQAGICTRKE